MEISLKDKVVLVTGAARGVGRGIAREMGKAGARVVLLDKEVELGKESAQLLRDEGVESRYEFLDLLKAETFSSVVESIISEFGSIDILVNNAGVVPSAGFLDTSRDELLSTFQVNVFGPFEFSQSVVKSMIERKIEGSILFTSSTHQDVTMLRPAYSASKAALAMMVKELALELTPTYGIRVNGVAPGVVAILGEENRSSEHVPIGYSAVPEDIGKAMVFLASDAASYITGHTLVVDGAFSLAHTHYWIKRDKI